MKESFFSQDDLTNPTSIGIKEWWSKGSCYSKPNTITSLHFIASFGDVTHHRSENNQ